MKELNKYNYEAWLLDWSEGNLSTEEKAELFQFLESHPELNASPTETDWPSLQVPQIQYPGKSDLYKSEILIPELTEKELNCVARLEGDLSMEASEVFDHKMEEDPGLKKMYFQFVSTKLKADQDIYLANKNDLKKRILVIPSFVYGALAIAATLILAWFVIGPMVLDQPPVELSQDTTRQVIYLNKIEHPAKYERIASVNLQPQLNMQQSAVRNTVLENSTRTRSEQIILEPLPIRQDNHVIQLNSPDYLLASSAIPTRANAIYQSLGDFAGDVIRERILGQDRDQVRKNQFSFWEVADAGLERVSATFNLDADIQREYNDEGDLVNVGFDSRLIAFSSPVRSAR